MGSATTKYLGLNQSNIQQNLIVKTITKVSLYKTIKSYLFKTSQDFLNW